MTAAESKGQTGVEFIRMAPTLLKISNLSKCYRLGSSNIPVLERLELRVAAAEMVAIMGPSGSGKTTLLNCISGIDAPDSGSVRLGDRTIDYTSEVERTRLRRHHIGMVFQFFNLIPTLTVEENVRLPFLIAKEDNPQRLNRVQSLLQEVGMTQRLHHFPSQLSGGEMQLVSIARALVHAPELLLADEPTGNVNPQVGRSIMRILRNTTAHAGTGVLMATHSPEHAAWADRVCFLKDGAICAEIEQHGEVQNAARIHGKLLELGI